MYKRPVGVADQDQRSADVDGAARHRCRNIVGGIGLGEKDLSASRPTRSSGFPAPRLVVTGERMAGCRSWKRAGRGVA